MTIYIYIHNIDVIERDRERERERETKIPMLIHQRMSIDLYQSLSLSNSI